MIANAAQDAAKLIANAAGEARTVVANNASEAAKMLVVKNSDGTSDHDTQIKLVEAVANIDKKFTDKFLEVRNDIQKLGDGTSKQIDDHEVRIGKLETSKTTQNVMMSIGIGLLSLLTTLLIYHLVK